MPNGFDLLCEDNLIDVLDCLLGPSIRDLGFTNKNMLARMKSKRSMEHLIRRLYKQNLALHRAIKNNSWSFSVLNKYI
jgi:hypothetical protein